MMRGIDIKKFLTGVPAWIFVCMAAVLLPLFSIMTIANINRQRENTQRLLVEKGAALIRSFEAGTRTGMMGRMHAGFKLQHLLSETAQQLDIIYLMVTDIDGKILAHSQLDLIGDNYGNGIDFNVVLEHNKVHWRRVKHKDGTQIFEVYAKFAPSLQHRRNSQPRFRLPRRRQPDSPGNFGDPRDRQPPRFIFIGLDTASISAAQRGDVVHAVVMGSILLFIASAGMLLLFFIQSYRSTQAALSRVKAFSNNLVNNMPIGMLALDKKIRIASFNHLAESILGFNPEKIIGQSARKVLPPELYGHFKRLATDKGVIENEIEFALADGRRVAVEVIATRLHDEDSKFLGFVFLLRDMREIHALRKEILRNQRLAAVGRLAAGVAHEIRNPLSSIKGFATYFKERYPDKADDQQIANIMIQEVERMNKVIGQLLDFARPIKIVKKRVPLLSLIKDSLKLIERQAEEKQIKLQTRVKPQDGFVTIDADRINQVLLNLYLNGLDAVDTGGHLTVTAAISTDERQLTITVSDDGSGISREDMSKIFDPYYTTKPTGTGLGLAIAHNIIRAHGGKITVETNLGQGASFTIIMPFSDGESTDE
jgi:two-component system sensor histidine kinase HydH